MPRERLSMRKIKEVLRLKWDCGLSERQIAKSCAIARSTVAEYVRRAVDAGLSWPFPDSLDDALLEQRLFPPAPGIPACERPEPNWSAIHQDLKKKGVTLALLWQEYKAHHPAGFQYSRFCDRYREWQGSLKLSMRQIHKAGEKLFVDYAGATVPVVDRHTGEVREAQIFVAVLGASSYTYAEATWTQTLPDWIHAHVRAFEFFGGVPELVIPDNLKTGVQKPCRYEPDLNPTYQQMATHYSTAIVPTRVRHPKDKAKVEVGVQVVERWILARLRHHTFFSLAELNRKILELVAELNARPFKKLPGSRRELFEALDRPALRPLPVEPYQYAEIRKARVSIDYHVEVDGHYYSVPYQLVKHEIEVRTTARTIECYFKGRRVASHAKNPAAGHHTTIPDHMPSSHRKAAEWTPSRIVRWAESIGPNTAKLVDILMESKPHPEQGFRASLGIVTLAKTYGKERLDAACRRALAVQSISYRSVKSILKSNLDRQPLPEPSAQLSLPIHHRNIRGPKYYQ